MSRYIDRQIANNSAEIYLDLRIPRKKRSIDQYVTPEMNYITAEQMSQLSLISYIWKLGDRFYKLAYKYYGDPQLWWVIAHFNKAPTEGHLRLGDVIYVPTPLSETLRMIRSK